jgi:hypothetical protein
MKLPDFHTFPELDSLRRRMGIPADVYGNLNVVIDSGRLSEDELDRLTSPDGLDIASLDDIRVLGDETLAFKNSRVLLYIRDHSVYSGRSIDPKFHVANCETLKEMKRRARAARYVIATRLDGTFRLNIINGTRKTEELKKLAVCQNCIDLLKFDGFEMTLSKPMRMRLVNSFTLDRFFEKFSRSLHTITPEHDSESAPLNDYAQDFSAKSNAARAAANWTCQNPSCSVRLDRQEYRRFLHVHHLNGLKSDDAANNLRVLCIGCHASEPNHGHMKSMPDYKTFIALKLFPAQSA